MITEHDLQEAIAECQGRRHPDAATCIKLAAFYTILDHVRQEQPAAYSFAPSPQEGRSMAEDDEVGYYGESDFLLAVETKSMRKVMAIMDELMTALAVLNPKLYDSVLRKIDDA